MGYILNELNELLREKCAKIRNPPLEFLTVNLVNFMPKHMHRQLVGGVEGYSLGCILRLDTLDALQCFTNVVFIPMNTWRKLKRQSSWGEGRKVVFPL